MSTTISAIPFLLLYSAGASIINFANYAKNNLSTFDGEKIHLDIEDVEKLLNSDIETQIMDKSTLLKTLDEYGAENIITDNDNISCDCDEFHLEFFKEPAKPYIMNISYLNPNDMKEFVQNFNNEYGINVQELSYNKIKERLEAQNLKIEEENIYEDNTIVLTVNLE